MTVAINYTFRILWIFCFCSPFFGVETNYGKQDVFFNPTLQHQTFKIKNKQWQTVFHLDWIFTEAYQVTEALVSLLQHWERKSVTIITHERQLRTVNEDVSFLQYRLGISAISMNIFVIDLASTKNITAHINDLEILNSHVIVACDPPIAYRLAKEAIFGHFAKVRSWIFVHTWKISGFWDFLEINPNIRLQINIISMSIPQDAQCRISLVKGTFCPGESTVHIYDAAFSSYRQRTILLKIGEWTRESGLHLFERASDVNSRLRLQDISFRVATFQYPPYLLVDRQRNQVRGYLKDVLDVLAHHLNFRYVLVVVNHTNYGSEVQPGVFDGIIGDVQRNEADIALNILSMTSARRRAIRFTAPIAHGHFAIFTRVPTIDQKTTAYILPFQNDVWFVIIATILILPAALLVSFCCIRVSIPSVDFMQFFVPKYAGLPTITGYLGRKALFIFHGTLLMSIMLIHMHYTSVFTSFLTHRAFRLPFDTIDDLSQNWNYNIMLVRGMGFFESIKASRETSYITIWNRAQSRSKAEIIDTVKDGIARLPTGNHALLAPGVATNFLIHNDCRIVSARSIFYREFFMFGMRHDFPYAKIFQKQTLRLYEHGILDRLAKMHRLMQSQLCDYDSKSSSIGLQQVKIPFGFLIIGWMIAMISLFFEKLSASHHLKRKNVTMWNK